MTRKEAIDHALLLQEMARQLQLPENMTVDGRYVSLTQGAARTMIEQLRGVAQDLLRHGDT